MRTSRSITALAFSTCTVLTIAGCSDGSVPTAEGAETAGHDHGVTTLYGPENELGEGISRAYIVVDHGGRPREVGIRMSESVLTGLPEVRASARRCSCRLFPRVLRTPVQTT